MTNPNFLLATAAELEELSKRFEQPDFRIKMCEEILTDPKAEQLQKIYAQAILQNHEASKELMAIVAQMRSEALGMEIR